MGSYGLVKGEILKNKLGNMLHDIGMYEDCPSRELTYPTSGKVSKIQGGLKYHYSHAVMTPSSRLINPGYPFIFGHL